MSYEKLRDTLFHDNNDHKLNYGFETDPNYLGHTGIDIRSLKVGNPVFSLGQGEVLETNMNANASDYGRYVWLYFKGYSWLYAHLDTIDVKKGQMVSLDTKIGGTGNTGKSTGPHFHLGVKLGRTTDRQKRAWLDPIKTFTNLPKDSVVKWNKQKGVYTLDMAVKERVAPNTDSKVVKTNAKGTKHDYVAWGNDDKYTWYELSNGNFMAYGERGVEIYGYDSNEPSKKPGKVDVKPVEKPKPKPEPKNIHGQYVEVGQRIQFSKLYTQDSGGKETDASKLYYKEKRGNVAVGYGYVTAITKNGYRISNVKGGNVNQTIGFARYVNVY